MTNRKSHTRFRLVPKSTTLDDLEGPLHTEFQNMRISEPTTKIWMKISDKDVAQWLDSGNIMFMRIFVVVLKI